MGRTIIFFSFQAGGVDVTEGETEGDAAALLRNKQGVKIYFQV